MRKYDNGQHLFFSGPLSKGPTIRGILIVTFICENNYQHSPCWGSTLLQRGCLVVGQSSILNEAKKRTPHWKRSKRKTDRQRGWNQSSDWSSQSSDEEDGCCFFWWRQRVQILAVNYVGAATATRWQAADNWDSCGGTPQGVHLTKKVALVGLISNDICCSKFSLEAHRSCNGMSMQIWS